MGLAVELITIQATAPGTGAVFAAVSGNSLTVRDTVKPVWLGPVWQGRQGSGFIRLTSPLIHDTTVGIQLEGTGGVGVSMWEPSQLLHAQDTLAATGAGSATAGDIEQVSMLWLYEDLPGVDGYFIDEAELLRRAEDIYSWPNTVSTGTAGGYSGEEVITSEADQLKANRDYAIVGYNTSVAVTSVRYRSSDWGNLGVGGPGMAGAGSGPMETRDWFRRVSRGWGMKAIPVFNASNKSLTLIDAAADENGADPVITTIAVLLGKVAGKGGGKRQ